MGVLGFAYYDIFNSVFEKENLEMGVLGFAYYDIFNSVFEKENLEMGVLGLGPRRPNCHFR